MGDALADAINMAAIWTLTHYGVDPTIRLRQSGRCNGEVTGEGFMAVSGSEESEPVIFTVRDGIATVTMNRPERRNASSWDLLTGLLEAIDRALYHPEVRVLVLTGRERYFCVGADAARVASSNSSDQDNRTLRGHSLNDDVTRLTVASTLVERLVNFPKPSIAAINGACAGAGLSLALATDLQVVDARASISTAFISAGVSGDLGSAWLLTRAVGTARARALLLNPTKMKGEDAVRIGLFTEVSDDLPVRVHALATQLTNQAPRAMELAKRNVQDAIASSLHDYLQAEVPRMAETAGSRDAKLAAQAFLDKTTPTFTGE